MIQLYILIEGFSVLFESTKLYYKSFYFLKVLTGIKMHFGGKAKIPLFFVLFLHFKHVFGGFHLSTTEIAIRFTYSPGIYCISPPKKILKFFNKPKLFLMECVFLFLMKFKRIFYPLEIQYEKKYSSFFPLFMQNRERKERLFSSSPQG